MKNDNTLLPALCLAAAALAAAGCAAPPPAASAMTEIEDAIAGAVEPAVEAYAPLKAQEENEDTRNIAVLWSRLRTRLFLPDPEHSTRSADEPTNPDLIGTAAAEDLESDDGAAEDEGTEGEDALYGALDGELYGPSDGAEPQGGGAAPAAGAAGDLWERIRARFAMPAEEHPRITAELQWYAAHPEYMARTIERARPYLYLIFDEIERRDLPGELALLPIVESAYQPFAYSHGRAAGLWQFIPATGRHYGLKQNWWYDGRRDVAAATGAALDYLQNLHQALGEDWLLALAAYNSGAGTVSAAVKENTRRGRSTDFWSLRLPRETSAYVPKLLALQALFSDPEVYGLEIEPVPDEPYLRAVDTGSQIDLALAAELADVPLADLYRLNPAFNRWATDPDGPHMLLLPLANAELFEDNIAQVPPAKRIQWARHRIREGETLGHIATRYRTTVAVLRQVNNLRGHMIRAGRSLIIPVATKDLDSYSLSAEQRRETTQNTPKQGTKVTYTVREGDTLWDIARKYRVGMREVARWNGMATRDVLRAGQELVVWLRPAPEARNALGTPSSRRHPLDNVTQRIEYTVRKGDSLARISQRFNVKVSQLRSWNSLAEDQHLQPGQKLTVYVDVIRQTENI